MNVKNMVSAFVALSLGAVAGYIAANKGETPLPESTPEISSGAAIGDNGAEASVRALRARIAELEKQLAEKGEKTPPAAPVAASASQFIDSHVERMKKMAKDDPERYAQITNRIANLRRRRSEQARSRIDFLSSIDTSGMSAEAKAVHEELQQLVARREELEEDLNKYGLDDTKRRELFRELRDTGAKMHELNVKERDNLLAETARNLGFEGADVSEIVTTVKEVINATEGGWGMRGFGPGGRGPRQR